MTRIPCYKSKFILVLLLSLFVFFSSFITDANSEVKSDIAKVYVFELKGPIGPATYDYLFRSFNNADKANASIIVLNIDTPGGLASSMRDINRLILGSKIPVVGYVSPSGAHAASAGTFILYACNIAAMAPGTNLGSASPISIGGTGGMDGKKNNQTSTIQKKVMEDSLAYIRSLAVLRDRNVSWAERFVANAESITAEEALKNNVINYKANNLQDLLTKINNTYVKINNEIIKLSIQPYEIKTIKPDWRSDLLAVITNPTVAYVLLLIGIYGIVFEFANPGFIAPGVIGAIAILLGMYSLHLLPLNYAGFALMLLGLGLMVAEAFVPSFGILGIAGIVAFILGSIFLIDTDVPGFTLSMPVIFTASSIFGAAFFIAIQLAFRSQRRPIVTGVPHLIGEKGTIIVCEDGKTKIYIQGAIWDVKSIKNLKPKDKVEVIGVENLVLIVKKVG